MPHNITTIIVHDKPEIINTVLLEAAVLKRQRSNDLARRTSSEVLSTRNNSGAKITFTTPHHLPAESFAIACQEKKTLVPVDDFDEQESEKHHNPRHVTTIVIDHSISGNSLYRQWLQVIKKQLGELAIEQHAKTTVNEKQFLHLLDKKDEIYKNLFQSFCRRENAFSDNGSSDQSSSTISVQSLLGHLTRASSMSPVGTLQMLCEITGDGKDATNNQFVSRLDVKQLTSSIAKSHNLKLSEHLLDALAASVIDGSLTNSGSQTGAVDTIKTSDFYAWLRRIYTPVTNLSAANEVNNITADRSVVLNRIDGAFSCFIRPPAPKEPLPLSKSISLIANNQPLPPSIQSKLLRSISIFGKFTIHFLIPRALKPRYVRRHFAQAMWWYVIALVFAGCFAYGLLRARLTADGIEKGITTPKCQGIYSGAKGFGFNLNLWCAALIALMCRRTLSAIRNTSWLRRWVPVDSSIYAHKMCAWWIVTPCIVGHVGFHLAHFACLTNNYQTIWSYADFLLTTKPQIGWWGMTVIFGWALLGCHAVILLGALPQVRRSGYFELFFWTHLLFVAYLTLLLMHSDKFWCFLIGPGAVYLFEKLIASRLYFGARHGKFFIREATLWPSGVTGLQISKPRTFRYRPGDYLFINIPAIAKLKWHPFTISNAPENEDYLTLHIRSLGNWTKRLHEYMRQRQRLDWTCKQNNVGTRGHAVRQLALCAAECILRTNHKASSGSNQQIPTMVFSQNQQLIANNNHLALPLGKVMVRNESETALVLPESANEPSQSETVASLQQMTPSTSVDESATLPASTDSAQVNSPAVMGDMQQINDESFVNRITHIDSSVAIPDLLFVSNAAATATVVNYQTITTGAASRHQRYKHPLPRRPTWQRRASIVGQRVVQRMRSLTQTLSLTPNNADALLRVYIDGPYGAPTSAMIEAAEHAVLICAGIGVTPSAAILESLVLRFKACLVTCRECHSAWTHDAMLRDGSGVYAQGRIGKNLKKVDFIWVVSSQAEVEWVYDRLQHIEREQDMSESLRQFITIHLYITSLRIGTYDAEDLPSLILDAALNATYEKQQIDAVTGLGFRANSGRPKWDTIFQKISNNRAGKVTVFFCGPPALARQLSGLCEKTGFKFSKENF